MGIVVRVFNLKSRSPPPTEVISEKMQLFWGFLEEKRSLHVELVSCDVQGLWSGNFSYFLNFLLMNLRLNLRNWLDIAGLPDCSLELMRFTR